MYFVARTGAEKNDWIQAFRKGIYSSLFFSVPSS